VHGWVGERHQVDTLAQEFRDLLMVGIAPKKSVSALEAFMSAMNWQCARTVMVSPFEGKRITLVVRKMKACLRRLVVPRLPFSCMAYIRKFMDFGRSLPRLWRASVIVAICFADFLSARKADLKKGFQHLVVVLLVLVVQRRDWKSDAAI
jgi:heme A synthase